MHILDFRNTKTAYNSDDYATFCYDKKYYYLCPTQHTAQSLIAKQVSVVKDLDTSDLRIWSTITLAEAKDLYPELSTSQVLCLLLVVCDFEFNGSTFIQYVEETQDDDTFDYANDEILDFTVHDLNEEVVAQNNQQDDSRLKIQYKVALAKINELQTVINAVQETKHHKPRVVKVARVGGHSSTATALLQLSDLHIGSIISPEYVKGRGYSPKMSAEFLDTIAEVTKVFILERESSIPVDELVISLNGDLIEVLDHGQSQLEIMEQVVLAQDLLYSMFKQLLSLGLPTRCIVTSGNHDRLGHYKKVPTDNRTVRSYDWVIAHNLARLLPAIDFTVELSYIAEFKVKGFDFIQHHGDCIKGGGGVGGIFPSLLKWHYKREEVKHFDFALMGHFHASHQMGKIFVNGGLPGASGYTDLLAINATQRCQNLLFVDSKFGVNTFHKIML